jgi:hypothetical protein
MTASRSPLTPPKPQAGTRKGNGAIVMAGVDGRTSQARRFKEVLSMLVQDMGGDPTEAQKAIAARAATLAVWCEQSEVAYAQGEGFDVASYTTASNAMRRLLTDLGLERRAQDVTPDLGTYLARKRAANV